MRKVLFWLLALLGFGVTGCGMVEYGTPHVHFNLKARVVDETGKPIEGIEARMKTNYNGAPDGIPFENRTGVSNYLGEIDAVSSDMWPNSDHEIMFIDPDGEANGGKFEMRIIDISEKIVQTDEGDGNWDSGSYKVEIGDVVMKLEAETADNENTNGEEE